MTSNWDPDPNVIAKIKEEIGKLPDEERKYGRIPSGDRLLTWDEVIEEIEAGTEFGRMYYYAYFDDPDEQ